MVVGEWQTKFNVLPRSRSLDLGSSVPDLGPDLDLTWDMDLDLSLTIADNKQPALISRVSVLLILRIILSFSLFNNKRTLTYQPKRSRTCLFQNIKKEEDNTKILFLTSHAHV